MNLTGFGCIGLQIIEMLTSRILNMEWYQYLMRYQILILNRGKSIVFLRSVIPILIKNIKLT